MTRGIEPDDDPFGTYITRNRNEWASLSEDLPVRVSDEMLSRLRSVLDQIDRKQVYQVYLPLTELTNLYVEHARQLYSATHEYLNLSERKTPFIIGIAGSVSVGKSTSARLLRELLTQGPGHPQVDLITTDGFLLPNHVLEERGLMRRKGFPESYDRKALLQFVMDVKSGVSEVSAPVYSHLSYDIVAHEQIVIRQPDILIVEGLNVLQPARVHHDGTSGLAVSDFFDFSVYVDASVRNLRRWYLERFMLLRETAFRDPRSYFTRFAAMDVDEAKAYAGEIWDTINGPNLIQNILPTRGRATVILRKNRHHAVDWVRIRKI